MLRTDYRQINLWLRIQPARVETVADIAYRIDESVAAVLDFTAQPANNTEQ